MKSTTPNASPDPLRNHPELRRRLRDSAARKRLAGRVTPDLPIDGDPVETRVPTPLVGTLMDGILDDLLTERSAFFDAVCAQWKTLFPDIPARPGRYQDGHLFIYVRAADPNAPKRFTLHLEIHSNLA